MVRYAREDHPMMGASAGSEYAYDPKQDIMVGEDQNGNVSRLLNQVQKQLSILHEELGGLANRLQSVSRSVPMEGATESDIDGPRPAMSPLAESVQIVFKQVEDATARVIEIRQGVDL